MPVDFWSDVLIEQYRGHNYKDSTRDDNNKNDAAIINEIEVEPLMDPSELSWTTSTNEIEVESSMDLSELSLGTSMYDGLSDTIFEGIDDGIGDDDGTNDVDEGTFEDEVSIEKLSSFIIRSCPSHSEKSLQDAKI